MFDLSNYKTDSSKQKEGIWIDFGGEASFKIAALRNPDFAKAFNAKREPYEKMKLVISEDDQLEIMIHCLARYIILDWKNVFENKKPIKYSVENAERVLREFEFVRTRIIDEASEFSNYIEEFEEEVAKN